jgi:hypothetical protein
MIRVEVVTSSDGGVRSVRIQGHGSAGYGKDLVCAGVSSCFVGALNAIEELPNFDAVVESGNSLVQSKKKPNPHDQVVLETLVVQLRTIASSYPEEVVVSSKKEGAK